MKAHQKILTKFMVLVVATVMCGLPELAQAQQAPQSSAGELPAAPAPQQKSEQFQQPLGAATAEGVTTVGGAASRPAGMAIAPDKQKDRRSLLIKLGLIAAAGIAVGTVAG